MSSRVILDSFQIYQKIKRISYQIYENTSDCQELFLFGISDNGYLICKEIEQHLKNISPQKINSSRVSTKHEKDKMTQVSTDIHSNQYLDKTVILIDDVINSGVKMAYCLRYFLEVSLYQLKTAVLIDRHHKLFPIKIDFKGLSLATTLQENVKVRLGEKAQVGLYTLQ